MEVLLPLTLANIPISNTAAAKRRRSHHLPLCLCRSSVEEIRVCTNRTCRRQGSLQTLQTLAALAPPTISVNSCGCLGRCGSGPNLVALPGTGHGAIVISHCGTAARSAEVMVALSGAPSEDAKKSLEALALRKRAEVLLEKGDFPGAESILSQAIELKPVGGIHFIYKDRSCARLAMNKCAEALEDAREALTFSPQYVEGYVCQGDAYLALDQFDFAEKSYLTALDIYPSIRRSKSFMARVAKLQEKMASVNVP